MAILDWIIVAAFLVFVLAMGAVLSRRAGGSVADFFISGRNLPWWLAGTSILATSFACDTPLHVTRIIREQGLSGAWFYWTGLLFAPMIPFLFARLWRRAGVITDCELIELRYSGRVAAALRVFMALFRTFGIAAITMGWVILGMAKVVRAIAGLPPVVEVGQGLLIQTDVCVVVILVVIAVVYTAMSGLWGVVATDFIEFFVALFGAIYLAVAAVNAVGGIGTMKEALTAHAETGGKALEFLPALDGRGGGLGLGSFFVYLLILGWAHAEADGGGNKAQRFLACKNERHALLSGIWTIAVQNIIRSWPWYIAALASIVLYPTLADPEMAYPMMIADLLPVGIRGLLVASFLAAFLSTIDTHLNLSASYMVNDVYRRFLAPGRRERHYVTASRLAVVGMALVVAVIALNMTSILDALKLKGELMAGLGLILLLRWYWPRVSAWSEIAALLSSVSTAILLRATGAGVQPVAALLGIDPVAGDLFPARLIIIVVVSALVTLVVTLMTPRTDKGKLEEFYRRVKPPGTGGSAEPLLPQIINWGLAAVFVAAAMFFVGKLVLAEYAVAAVLLAIAAASGWGLLRRLREAA